MAFLKGVDTEVEFCIRGWIFWFRLRSLDGLVVDYGIRGWILGIRQEFSAFGGSASGNGFDSESDAMFTMQQGCKALEAPERVGLALHV